MKYLKKFQTETDLNAFNSSSEFIKPNLCAVVERVGVEGVSPIIFTPKPSTITFTIDGVSYKANPGMYWHEWLDSEYNTINAAFAEPEHGAININRKELKLRNNGCVMCYYNENVSDAIIEGGDYYTGNWCSPIFL